MQHRGEGPPFWPGESVKFPVPVDLIGTGLAHPKPRILRTARDPAPSTRARNPPALRQDTAFQAVYLSEIPVLAGLLRRHHVHFQSQPLGLPSIAPAPIPRWPGVQRARAMHQRRRSEFVFARRVPIIRVNQPFVNLAQCPGTAFAGSKRRFELDRSHEPRAVSPADSFLF